MERHTARQASQEALNSLSLASLSPPPVNGVPRCVLHPFGIEYPILLRPALTAKALFTLPGTAGDISLKPKKQNGRLPGAHFVCWKPAAGERLVPKPEGPEKPGGGTKAQPEKHRDHSDIWREPFAARFCRMRAEGAKPALRRPTRLKQGGPAGLSKGRGTIIFNRPFPCRGVCSSDKPDACPQIRRGSILQREAAGTGGAPDRGYGRERK